MNKLGLALLIALPVTAAAVCASARRTEASAETFLNGTDFSNIFPLGETPVTIEKESITARISSLPRSGEEQEKSSASVTAAYTLYNPTPQGETVEVGFPCGCVPDYADYASFYDKNPCTVEIGGERAKPSLRHVYAGSRKDSVGTIMTEGEESFYSRDLPVTKYTFRVQMDGEEEGWTYLVLHYDCSPRTTRVICPGKCDMRIDNGMGKIAWGFEASGASSLSFEVYAVGEEVSWESQKLLGFSKGQTEAHGYVSSSAVGMSFSELAMRGYPADGVISEEDWYNGYVDMLEACTANEYMVNPPATFSREQFMRWYEFSVPVPALGRTETKIVAPLFPDVRDGGEGQTVYSYSVLLSPGHLWKSFGSIEIKIVTGFHLSNSSLQFVTEEGAYLFTREKLPQGELSFSLTEDAPIPPNFTLYAPGREYTALYIVLGTLGGAAAVTVVVLAIVVRRRKRRRMEEERRLLQSRVREGAVDLPDRRDGE